MPIPGRALVSIFPIPGLYQQLRPTLRLARPVLLVHLIVRRILAVVMLLVKLAVMLVNLAPLLLGQVLGSVGARDAEVGDFGLGRGVARGRVEGFASAGAALGRAVSKGVRHAFRVLALVRAKDGGGGVQGAEGWWSTGGGDARGGAEAAEDVGAQEWGSRHHGGMSQTRSLVVVLSLAELGNEV